MKAYFALKMAGDDPQAPHMARARQAIHAMGGAEATNVFTRTLLALYGVMPWTAVPMMPVEIMLLPRWFPFHLSKVSYWARTVIVPLLVLMALKPRARNPRKVDIRELFVTPPEDETNYMTNPTGSLWGRLDFLSGGEAGDVSLYAEIYAQDDMWFSNTGDSIGPDTQIDGYELVNARLDWNNIFGSNVSAALFGRNLTDEDHFVGGMALGASLGHNAAVVGEPLTYGAELSYRF